MSLKFSRNCFCKLLITVLLLFCAVGEGYGQRFERVYAKSQTNGGTFLTSFTTNPQRAVDQDVVTYSTIGVTVIGEVWQQLSFEENLSVGTKIKVKIGTLTNLLKALGNITIQGYYGNNAVGSPVTLSSALSLLAGEDQGEVVFAPSALFNAVRISSSGIALGGGLKIYEAYYLKETVGNSACDKSIDVLYGSTGDIAGGLNVVENAGWAIDLDVNTAATLKANVSAAGNKTHIMALYDNLSVVGDSLSIVLKKPGGLLDASLLSNSLSIKTYIDNSDNGALELDENLLSLRLLSVGSNIQVLTYPIDKPFNRVEISLGGGLLNALASLEIYEIRRIIASPKLTAPNFSNDEAVVCEGNSVTLSVIDPVDYFKYHWYLQEEGGKSFHEGASYIRSSTAYGESYNYYVSVSRSGCTEESRRVKVGISTVLKPGAPHLTISNIND